MTTQVDPQSSMTWYLSRSGRTVGPLTQADIVKALNAHKVRWIDQVLRVPAGASPRQAQWRLLHEYAAEFENCRSQNEVEGALTAGQESWVIAKSGAILGPFVWAHVTAKLAQGVFSYRDLAWRNGMIEWKVLADCEEFSRQSMYRTSNGSFIRETIKADFFDPIPEESEDFVYKKPQPDFLRDVVRRPSVSHLAVSSERPEEAAGEDLLETPSWLKFLVPVLAAVLLLKAPLARAGGRLEMETTPANSANLFTPVVNFKSEPRADGKVGAPIVVRIYAPAGHVVVGLSYEREVKLPNTAVGMAQLNLRSLGLPDGDYQIDASLEGATAHTSVTIGAHSRSYSMRMSKHLKEVAEELQKQQKVIYYSAREIAGQADQLAARLAQTPDTIQALSVEKKTSQSAFYNATAKRIKEVLANLAKESMSAKGERAYPRETEELHNVANGLLSSIEVVESKLTGQRNVASASDTKARAEIERGRSVTKAMLARFGRLTAR